MNAGKRYSFFIIDVVLEEPGFVVIVHISSCVRIVILPSHITHHPRRDSYVISATMYPPFRMNVRNVHDMDSMRLVLAYNALRQTFRNSFQILPFHVLIRIIRRNERMSFPLSRKVILFSPPILPLG